jgi:hypothetical protein
VEDDWHSGIFYLQHHFSQQMVHACIVVVPTRRFATSLPRAVASFELVTSTLRWAKMWIDVPILTIGVEPSGRKSTENAESDGSAPRHSPHHQAIQHRV